MFADLVLQNGKIVTIDKVESIVEAVAVKFGKILAAGKNVDVEALIGSETEVIDLEGRTVIPGLIDSHCHMIATGGRRMITVDLSQEAGVNSIEGLKARIAEKAENTPSGEWIFGAKEDDSKLVEKRHPTRWELDEATRDHPERSN